MSESKPPSFDPPGGEKGTPANASATHERMATHVNRGLAWVGVASSLVGVLDILALVIILGNWVSTEDFGIAALCMWLFPILDQATDLGLSAAVIQRDDHDEAKISTVFWINLSIALVLFGLLAVVAPIYGGIYEHPVIGFMLIAYGTKLIWQNIYFIPTALMKRELRFKELSIIRVLANCAEFIGKVGFAWAGFGIWCFVLGPLCRVLVTGIGSQIAHPWRPKLVFRYHEAKEYVSFGLKSSGSQILFYFYTNIDYPIVGYYFGPLGLGVYKLAYEVVLEPVRVISNVVVDIAFPAFAKLRHDRDRLIAQFVSFTKLNLITVMAYSAIVFVSADDLIHMLFPRQDAAIPAIRILCAVAVLRSVSFVIPPLLDGLGYPNRTLKYMLVAAVVLPLSFVLGSELLGDHLIVLVRDEFGYRWPSGFLSVTVAWAVGYPVAFAVLVFMALYTLNWSPLEYLRAVAGVPACMIAGGIVGAATHWALDFTPPPVRLAVTSAVIIGVSAWLLAYTQGLSLRTAKRALKGEAVSPVTSDRDDPL